MCSSPQAYDGEHVHILLRRTPWFLGSYHLSFFISFPLYIPSLALGKSFPYLEWEWTLGSCLWANANSSKAWSLGKTEYSLSCHLYFLPVTSFSIVNAENRSFVWREEVGKGEYQSSNIKVMRSALHFAGTFIFWRHSICSDLKVTKYFFFKEGYAKERLNFFNLF